jgi:hypothetical protein
MKESPDVAETLIQTPDEVEDESAVGDDLAKGREIVGHLLQPAAVVSDRELALDEVAEPRLEMNGAGVAIAEELRLDGKPRVPGGGALG